MKTITIKAEKRTEVGKSSSRKLRKIGHVPCVMYGGDEVLHFHAHENDFRHIVYTPDAFLIKIDLDGEIHNAVLKELQFHPVSDHLIHIDFVEVSVDRPVTMELPIRLVGSAIGIKNGGKSRQRRRTLKARGLLKDLPETLDIDITNTDITDVIKVGDLSYENIEILDPPRSMIYSIVSSRVSMKGMELTEPGEAVAEAAEAEGVAEGVESPEAGEGEEKEEGAES
ncbi:MAG TPA: 50S ribosomal protein L25 [Bacteroides sp.]|nr:50S ribosomal protein L25 [Bacteroides sp.]